jgi:hypothetical protein
VTVEHLHQWHISHDRFRWHRSGRRSRGGNVKVRVHGNRSSRRLFGAGGQNHVWQNLVPENAAAPGGIVGEWRYRATVILGTFGVGMALGMGMRAVKQPMNDLPPLLGGHCGQSLLYF